MKQIKHYIPLFILSTFLSFAISSCDGTKHLAEGESLLVSNRIVSSDKDYNVSSLYDYIVQKPNTKWFSTLKVPLGIYTLSGRDTTKTINRILQKWGEAPVCLDTTKVAASQENLRQILFNQGFLDAGVEVEQHARKRRVKVDYILFPKQQYVIRSVSYNIRDNRIDSLLRANNVLEGGGLKAGEYFSVTGLSSERKRISTWLNNNGYRYFNKEFISYHVDSCKAGHYVNVSLNIELFRRNNNENYTSHPYYHIRNIRYTSPQEQKLRIRPSVLNVNTVFREGELYDESKIQKTYRRFADLGIVRSTNISFVEVNDSNSQDDNGLLDAVISISQHNTHNVTLQPEGTNTAGDLGAALSLTYENRNVFHGSELFSLSARGAFEAIKGLEGYANNNYEEYGIEAKLSFPEFLCPNISEDYRRRHKSTTEFLLSYNKQNRPEFDRRVFSGKWRYRWSSSTNRVGYTLDFINIDYVSMPWISDTFKRDYLDSKDNRNAILRYNYENLLIMKLGFSFNYNDGIHYLKVSMESAGNLLKALSKPLKFKTNDMGQYEFLKVAYAQYAKADVDYTYNYRIDERNTLALHSRIGIAMPYGNSTILPYEKRYFSGGANSVRGWSVRELGPGCYHGKDGRIDFINQTGDLRLDLNAELRSSLFWKFQGAIFIDAGNIWTVRQYADQPGGLFTLSSLYKEIAVAYGVGLRLNFDYFILRLDLGMKAISPYYTTTEEHYPISNPNFKRDYALHFAVGLPF
ncbi:MAG: BamA/TamA family outer membrane protein [Prevotella sp.]|nr:BamA/TamA family outer membrane protein [Prevotella sp.]